MKHLLTLEIELPDGLSADLTQAFLQSVGDQIEALTDTKRLVCATRSGNDRIRRLARLSLDPNECGEVRENGS